MLCALKTVILFLGFNAMYAQAKSALNIDDINKEESLQTPMVNDEIACDCKNGKCRVTSQGEVLCECLPEYGKRLDTCEACDCGTGANCTWEGGIFGFGEKKYCLCPDGSKLKEQHCEAIEATSSVTFEPSSLMTAILTSTVAYCYCGKNSRSCHIDWRGRKVCNCYSGYAENRGYCEAIDSTSSVTFESSSLMTAILTSTVTYCNCGENSRSCHITWRGEKVCNCYSGFAEKRGYCEECNCGPYGSCSFEYGRKKCDCKSFAVEIKGVCVDMGVSTPWSTPVTESTTDSFEISTTHFPTEQDCYCGENSKSCRFDWNNRKICDCFLGYEENNGYCDECNCGPYGFCKFEYGRKQCYCRSFAIEKNGVCVVMETTSESPNIFASTDIPSSVQDCYCGSYSYSCYLDSSGNRVCNCFFGFSQLGGLCAECNCGPYGSCSFEYGRKKCNCRYFAVEINGVCVGVETSSSEGTTDSYFMSTLLSSTVQDCNCGPYGSCSFKYGRKKCHCRSFAVEINGVCVDVGTSSESTTHSHITSTILSSTVQDICNEDKCLHGKCENIKDGFICRCNEGFTGPRCEDKIQTKSNKQDLLLILQLTGTLAIFILLFGMFCFLVGILNKKFRQ